MHIPRTDPANAAVETKKAFPTVGGAYFALMVLFSMNLLNYVDRYVFFAVGKLIQDELAINDLRFGFLSSSFMVVYTLVSPLMGYIGDRYSRRVLLGLGVGLWSIATVGTAFSRGFNDMFVWRAILGIGEASYGIIAPTLLADLFRPKDRGRVMGLFYLALPVGGAIGYGLGGWVGATYGWRTAFWVVGLPGLIAAVAGLLIHDPGRGASEGKLLAARPGLRDYLSFFRNRTFLFNTAGLAAVTFATGAYAAWGATFYQRVRGLSPDEAGKWIGGLTLIAGLLGIGLGTWIADFLLRFTRRAYLVWASLAVTAAVPFGLLGILDPEPWSSLGLLFVAMVLLASVLGPCNTVTANVVPSNQRAAGFAVSIFLLHLFGDISSPILIGFISDLVGSPAIAGSPLGRLLEAFGAGAVGETNLTVGMLVLVPALALGGFFFLLGSRHLPEDQDRARQAGGDPDEPVFAH